MGYRVRLIHRAPIAPALSDFRTIIQRGNARIIALLDQAMRSRMQYVVRVFEALAAPH